MSPAWAIYCERQGGWLVDTSYVWSFDVGECEEFNSMTDGIRAISDMIDNGHTFLAGRRDVHVLRIR